MTSADEPQDPNAWLPPPAYGYPPGYGPPSGYPPGYGPPPGYGFGYGAPLPPPAGYPQPGPGRPGPVVAAAVLGFVLSALCVIASVFLAIDAAIVHSLAQDYFYFGDDFGDDFGGQSDLTLELSVHAVVSFALGTLVLVGSVLVTAPGTAGRGVLSVGCVLCVGDACYWMTWLRSAASGGALLFLVLAVAATVLVWTPPVARWLRARSRQPG